ncbi:MAG: hypothetical protein RLZZ603_660, partial [Actinomycetota bacterium]
YEDPRYHDTLYRAQQEAPYRPMRIAPYVRTYLDMCEALLT